MSAKQSTAERPSWVAHFFASADQQKSAANFGMWLFIGQEVLFFSGLFMAYIAYRWLYPGTWLSGADVLNKWLGAANTVVLLTSSLTMVLAVRELELNRIKQSVRYLWVTVAFGFVFLGVKAVEYASKFELGICPANRCGRSRGNGRAFFGIYYTLTALHAPVISAWVSWHVCCSRQRGNAAENNSPREHWPVLAPC